MGGKFITSGFIDCHVHLMIDENTLWGGEIPRKK